MSQPYSGLRLWGIPAVLGVLTCFGLLAALLGTGVWHFMAWVALAVPLIVGVWFWIFPKR
jgi:hypothetical protein